MMEKDAFKDAMEEALHSHLKDEHRIIGELERPPGDRELLKFAALQGYQLTKNFARYVGALYNICPMEKHRRRLAMNLYEEETGKISKTRNHLDLMVRFLKGVGATDKEMDEATPLPNTQYLIDWRWKLARDPDNFHKAAAAIAIASEGQNLEERAGRPSSDILPKMYGLDEKDLIFYRVHATEDVYHVQDGLKMVADACENEQMQQEAIDVINETCLLFIKFYDGILGAYAERKAAAVPAS